RGSPETGRPLGSGEARRGAIAIDDAAAKPAALIAARDEAGTIRGDANGGQSAELLVGRGELEPAAEQQLTELPARRVARVEARDRLGADVDLEWRVRRARCGARRLRRGRECGPPEYGSQQPGRGGPPGWAPAA